jgi:DNA-binding CsgD family transcriptional regulator
VGGQDTVTEQDLRHLLQLVDQAREAPGAWAIPAVVLTGLRELVPCTDISFPLLDPRARLTVGGVYLEGGHTLHDLALPADDPDEDAAHQLFWDEWAAESGCGYPQVTRNWTTVLRCSDRMSDRAFAATPSGWSMRSSGVRHEVLVALPPLGDVERRLLLFRHDGPDFSEREVLLLKIFRPHLLELHAEQRRRLLRPELTTRQWEVLRRVAAGASNAQVARALSISEATVRKHLENAFGRLDVRSRTEAVARLHPLLEAGASP